ncbi:unnamed protein product [Schistocephalus solidus]|uniref:Reverse transcriptase domain-containing protein n=1 Tax=Schistocephalus solidus TaxID=70667 RepID=A0A183S769_SCHSO|nr:unnamed protein product [Schistocephalus solidus]
MTFTDQTEIFSDILASKRFPSYELFRQALEYFTKVCSLPSNESLPLQISGSKFSKGKTSLHRPGSLNRDILLYRSAEFQCSSKCEACFVIGCKKGHLFVIRYHMVHNHSIDYQVTPSPNPHPVVEIPEVPQADVDLTVQFNAHFPSLKFSSYDDLMEALTSFQKRTGSVYVKKGVHKLPTGHANSDLLVYSTMCFQCIHYDHPSLRHLPLPSSEYYEEVIDVDQLESKEISPVRTLGVGISSYSSLSPFPLSKANDYEGSQRRTSIETMLQCIRGILAKSDISAFEKRTSDLRRLVRSWEMDPIVDPERMTNGVKQGCVLAPTLFILMFSAMLMDACRAEQPGIRMTYRTDGHLLNSQRMQAPTRVSTTIVHELLLADDCALNTVRCRYGDRQQGGQKRRYKDTLKKSLKQPQINPVTWADFTQDRPAWRRSVRTGAAIYETNRSNAAKAKRVARKSPAPRTNTAGSQALPTCPRCQRIFRARIGLVGHLQTECKNNHITSTSATTASVPTAHDHRNHRPSSTTCANHGDEHHMPHSHHLSSHV